MTEEIELAPPEPISQPEPAEVQRFPILISPLWRPFLFPFGATPERAFAAIEDNHLHVRFGRLFDHRFPLKAVEGVAPSHWPVWAGVGWRTNLRGTIGLVGSYVNIVEIRFKEPQRVRLLFPFTCKRLALSLEEPRDFIAALARYRRAPRGEEPGRRQRRAA